MWIVEVLSDNAYVNKTECDSEAQAKRFAKLHLPTFKSIIYKEEKDGND